MSEASSKRTVIAAVTANIGIAAIKFVAAAATGSAAMGAEGVHSMVDTGNGLLMLLGMKESKKPADARHPFGHGKELYFWTLVVAVSIFASGGAISIFKGIQQLRYPHPMSHPFWNYMVLGVSALCEGSSFCIAMKAFLASKRKKTILDEIVTSKDPTTFTVVLEDSAALSGLVIAFFGIYLGQSTGSTLPDGVASILIGIMLCGVALFLGRESKGLLVGEGVEPSTVAQLRALVERDTSVERVITLLTMHLGPHEVLLNMAIQFKRELSSQDVVLAIDRIEADIRKQHPDIKRIFIEAESLNPGRRVPA